ncbi:hypothetical protein CCR95_24180 [Thiocystis minor]|uniref:hypothetical protein n=1 Tax=Thiocystis minor TaxID=61597 RepID=UPI001913560C|nr:hypothetical protein [Thiocystis minor]MBK5967081.1 hypothetical protein [Thiocystis minor]
MLHFDPARLFSDLVASSNQTAIGAILADGPFGADGGLALEDFVNKHAATITTHFARTAGVCLEFHEASQMTKTLWEYLAYLQSWSEVVLPSQTPEEYPEPIHAAPMPSKTAPGDARATHSDGKVPSEAPRWINFGFASPLQPRLHWSSGASDREEPPAGR